jgi:hypothetical protein
MTKRIGYAGVAEGQPVEQRHVMGKPKSAMPRLQVLIADRGGNGQ